MTPLKLKEFLMNRHHASIDDIEVAFGIGTGLALELLNFWIKRGCCVETKACDSCKLCDVRYYKWKSPCIKP